MFLTPWLQVVLGKILFSSIATI